MSAKVSCTIAWTLNWHFPQQALADVSSRTASTLHAPASTADWIVAELTLLQIQTTIRRPMSLISLNMNSNDSHFSCQQVLTPL